jgi:hypothetical protein
MSKLIVIPFLMSLSNFIFLFAMIVTAPLFG